MSSDHKNNIMQKRVQDLMEQLISEQESLEDLVQNKIDENINNMIDNEIEKIEENADKQIEDLESMFTETKIAELVAQAINTGVFTDIEGNLVSLDEALMDFANHSAEYMGVMGDSLKTELLQNLNIALDTMNQLNEINKELGNYDTSSIMPQLSTISSIKLEGAPVITESGLTGGVTLGDLVVNIQGNVDENTLTDIEILLENQRKQIINEIMTNVL